MTLFFSKYFQDGTFYCQDSDDYSCLAAYKITNTQRSRTWKCGRDGSSFFEVLGKELRGNGKLPRK